MLDTRTEKSLENVVIFDNKKVYKNIIDNCTMYAVKPNGNKVWLMDNWVLVEWFFCNHTNPFESWKLPNNRQAKEFFDSFVSDND
tara:strand:+ start:12506 stop:12760 length:255 start_codon:yes stop_codon:yes gene_type:complete